jgi:UDP-glucose 4-epimerase
MILVTGGFGFIGSHLVEELIQRGEIVHVIDDGSTAAIRDPNAFHQRIRGGDRLGYYLCSVQDYCRKYPRRDDIARIYHLASPVGPAGILKYAGQMAKQIIDDIDCLMDLALLSDARLLFVSTSEVYGGGVEGLCREDMPKVVSPDVSVRLEYGVGKLAAEIALLNRAKVMPLDAAIIRPSMWQVSDSPKRVVLSCRALFVKLSPANR